MAKKQQRTVKRSQHNPNITNYFSYFPTIKEEIEHFEKKREGLILITTKIVQLSKEIIYATHRKEFAHAEKKVKEARQLLAEVRSEVEQDAKLDIGAYKVAVQEYVESLCYLRFIRQEQLPTHQELTISAEYYLLGLCDLVGELSRAAMNAAINDDHALVERIRQFVYTFNDELMQINFRNGELRKKVDGVRYELQKLDTIVFQLKQKK